MPVRRPALILALASTCLLAPAGLARAATLTSDAACYTESSAIGLAGAGFPAGSSISITGEQIAVFPAADETGAFTSVVAAPLLGTIKPIDRSFTITATDPISQAAAQVSVRVARFTFDTSSGVASPRAKRLWRFSGFLQNPGKAIYGHFRHNGHTFANYRFGVPSGPCGKLRKRAPGIPVRHPKTGQWKVQVDFAPRYHVNTRPAVTSQTTVFTTFG